MALTFIDIYNSVAEQAWSMYDADAETKEDFESGLKSSINKALSELWCSYDFHFRIKTYIVKTQKDINSYDMPTGNIIKKSINDSFVYSVRIDRKYLSLASDLDTREDKVGKPTEFQVYNDNLLLYPTPNDEFNVIIEYLELAISEDDFGDKIYELKNDEDTIDVPEKLETLFKNALITKSMLYAIASKSDENYSGYLEQYENAYKNLIKYCIGIDTDKRIVF